MKYYFLAFLVLVGFFTGFVYPASAQEPSWQKEDIVIEGGDITKVTYDFKNSSVKIQVEMEKEGHIIIPNLHFIAADPDCTPSDEGLFVLVDNTETDLFQIDDAQNMKIPLPPNTEKIEIISSHVLVLYTYSSIYGEFCKMLDGGNHASPHKQLEMGFLVKDIICKDNLTLVFHSMSNNPACITKDNAEKFFEHGYSEKNIFPLPFSKIYRFDDGSIVRYSIYGAVLQYIELDDSMLYFHIDSNNNGGIISASIPNGLLLEGNSKKLTDLNYKNCRSGVHSYDSGPTHQRYLETFHDGTIRVKLGCE